jgi:demethoxyubiquinone hydroxylase (CLK1/Coq7/Cat5 family)
VYYFLGEYDEALSFALGAGNAFEAESRAFGAEEYVETVVCEWYLVSLFVRKLKKWVA